MRTQYGIGRYIDSARPDLGVVEWYGLSQTARAAVRRAGKWLAVDGYHLFRVGESAETRLWVRRNIHADDASCYLGARCDHVETSREPFPGSV